MILPVFWQISVVGIIMCRITKSFLVVEKPNKHSAFQNLFFLFYEINYLTSTAAPASSSFFLISAASSGAMSFLISAGTPSTSFLASTSPRPVISLTALITATLVAPTSFNVTVTVLGSAAAPASAAAATATGAAAETPYFSSIAFTSSLSSRIVASSKYARISSCVNFTVLIFLLRQLLL